MALKLYNESDIQDIADAIRGKNGSSDTYTVSQMAQAIDDIPSGGGGEQFYQLLVGTITNIDDDNITELRSSCFYGLKSLKTFKAKNLTILPGECFFRCDVEQVFIPRVTTIYGSNAFNSAKITSLALPSITGSLEMNKINSASLLHVLDFGPALSNIASYALNNLTLLDTIILRSPSLVSLGATNAGTQGKFAQTSTGGTLYVPSALISSYQSATNWSTVLGYANNSIQAIEGSQYENYYADGTPIS